jgi:hypothetical protein
MALFTTLRCILVLQLLSKLILMPLPPFVHLVKLVTVPYLVLVVPLSAIQRKSLPEDRPGIAGMKTYISVLNRYVILVNASVVFSSYHCLRPNNQ